MAGKSKIEWCTDTWNPVVGCSIVSPGCTNCYAMKQAYRIEKMSEGAGRRSHYAGTTQQSKAGAVWTGKVNLAPDHIITQPLRWKRPRRIFVNSMSDLFHEDIPDEWIDKIFAVMALCPRHTFQVLTKRPERMRDYMKALGNIGGFKRLEICARNMGYTFRFEHLPLVPFPIPNIWLGTSVEDQARADERIPSLLSTPAAVRFLSCEPLLGQLDIHQYLSKDTAYEMQEKRRVCLSSCSERGYSDLSGRNNLENPQERMGSLEEKSSIEALHTSQSRKQCRKVSTNSSNDRREKGICAGPPTGIQAFQWGDTGGIDDKSQRRDKEEQSPKQSGIGNTIRTNNTCGESIKNSRCGESMGGGKPQGETDTKSGGQNQNKAKIRRESKDNSQGLRSNISDNIQNSKQNQMEQSRFWVICGGESGPGARPMHPDWARSLRDQCQAVDVPFFMKQMTKKAAIPNDLLIREYPNV